jgi:asparaginyl-tRNA synthetase
MAVPATVATIASYVDQEVELQGWLYNKRGSGKIAFLMLRDGTGIIQCIASKAELELVEEGLFQRLRKLGQESSLLVRGRVRAEERAPFCGHEIHVTGATVVGESTDYPITKKEHGPAFLHDHRHLWFRSRRQQAILRVRHAAVRAIREYFDQREYLLVDSPILTPNACEGTSTLFATDYYGRPAFLTQSGQLYQEAGATAFRKTYCFGPTFRAEKSDTRRHLTEF